MVSSNIQVGRQCRVGTKRSQVCLKNYYAATTTNSLNCWCIHAKFWPYQLNVAAEIETNCSPLLLDRSGTLNCNERLPVSPFYSDFWYQQGISVHTTDAHWIFSLLLEPLSVNPTDGCRSAVFQIKTILVMYWTMMYSKSLKVAFFPIWRNPHQ